MSNTNPCPDCDGLVSNAAKTCPHCGRPVSPSFLRREAESAVSIAKTICIIVIVGMLALAGFALVLMVTTK